MEFYLHEWRIDSRCQTTYKLATRQLDVEVSTQESDGDNLILANIIPYNNEKPIKIYPTSQNEDVLVLKGFIGSIIGYPTMQLSVCFHTYIYQP